MIFLDASAIVAILNDEEDADDLADRLALDRERFTSPIALYETNAALMRTRVLPTSAAREMIDRFLAVAEVGLTPIGAMESDLALAAFERFGKGRHPAGLNMGDCFAYACAKAMGAKLLFKGDDFPLTDVAAA